MRALSVRAPWGQFVMAGWKTLETRTWPTKHRGPLLFVCSKTVKSPEAGLALCVADVVACRPFLDNEEDVNAACHEWFPNGFAWELENLRLVEQFPVKGQLGFFNVPDDLIEYVSALQQVMHQIAMQTILEAKYGGNS